MFIFCFLLISAQSAWHPFLEKTSEQLSQLKHYEVIVLNTPHYNDYNHQLQSAENENEFYNPIIENHPAESNFYLQAFDKFFNVSLIKQDIFHPNYREIDMSYKNGELIAVRETPLNEGMKVHYSGFVADQQSSTLVSVAARYGGFRGFIKTAEETYGIEPAVLHFSRPDLDKHLQRLNQEHSSKTMINTEQGGGGSRKQHLQSQKYMYNHLHMVYRLSSMDGGKCGVDDDHSSHSSTPDSSSSSTPPHQAQSASGSIHELLASKIRTNNRNNHMELFTTGYNELLVVNDFQRYRKRLAAVTQESTDTVSQVRTLYLQTSFKIVVDVRLIAQVTWSTGDPYATPACTAPECQTNEIGVGDLLSSFHSWRTGGSMVPPHDNAQLFSGYDFQGSVLGYAGVGQMCNYPASGGINMVPGVYMAAEAATVAHEMGHNFNMIHDGSQTSCSNALFIMNAFLSGVPNMFSQCSIDAFNSYNNLGCLSNVPDVTGRCGDGIVQSGEFCDCGSNCAGSCCNGTSCQLREGASCLETDACCTSSCTARTEMVLCRAQSGECDVPEYCNGVSGTCPGDVSVGAGTPCYDGIDFGNGVCFKGFCISADSQCQSMTSTLGNYLACPVSLQKEYNSDGNYCGAIWCREGTGQCSYFRSNGLVTQTGEGVPCTSDRTSHCVGGSCVRAQSTQPNYYWLPSAWVACSDCTSLQNRTISCVYQDQNKSPRDPPVPVNDTLCPYYDRPPITQICNNATLGCRAGAGGFLGSSSISFFGVEMKKSALILTMLGVLALSMVILACCYKGVTNEESEFVNARIRTVKSPAAARARAGPPSPQQAPYNPYAQREGMPQGYNNQHNQHYGGGGGAAGGGGYGYPQQEGGWYMQYEGR